MPRHTGISVLLNTSFNRRGMPIVETPEEAIAFFLECALDALMIDDFLVTKRPGRRGGAGLGRRASDFARGLGLLYPEDLGI